MVLREAWYYEKYTFFLFSSPHLVNVMRLVLSRIKVRVMELQLCHHLRHLLQADIQHYITITKINLIGLKSIFDSQHCLWTQRAVQNRQRTVQTVKIRKDPRSTQDVGHLRNITRVDVERFVKRALLAQLKQEKRRNEARGRERRRTKEITISTSASTSYLKAKNQQRTLLFAHLH